MRLFLCTAAKASITSSLSSDCMSLLTFSGKNGDAAQFLNRHGVLISEKLRSHDAVLTGRRMAMTRIICTAQGMLL